MHKVSVQLGVDTVKLNLPETVLSEAFVHHNILEMDATQLSILLFTTVFNIEYDESSCNITSLMIV